MSTVSPPPLLPGPMGEPAVRRLTLRLILLSVVRAVVVVVALFVAYFLIPVSSAGGGKEGLYLVASLGAFAVVLALQLRAITRSKYPRLRAFEALAVLIPLFLLVFSRIYLSIGHQSAGSFSQQLTTVTALYFTTTVFATVGFGDITATSSSAQMIVSVQMILDLVVLGATVKVLAGAAKVGLERQQQEEQPELPARGSDPAPSTG